MPENDHENDSRDYYHNGVEIRNTKQQISHSVNNPLKLEDIEEHLLIISNALIIVRSLVVWLKDLPDINDDEEKGAFIFHSCSKIIDSMRDNTMKKILVIHSDLNRMKTVYIHTKGLNNVLEKKIQEINSKVIDISLMYRNKCRGLDDFKEIIDNEKKSNCSIFCLFDVVGYRILVDILKEYKKIYCCIQSS